ncbi:MAG: MoaD/ThiS family protein [Tunicatimonas sp.]
MKLNLLLFGATRDIMGEASIAFEVPADTTVSQLLDQLHQRYPALKDLRSLLLAVNSAYGQPEQVLGENDEIALIPPVSGG